MKTMTCKQLAGACDEKFSANTFEEIAQLSKKHAMEMFAKKDNEHLAAMTAMKHMNLSAQQEWFKKKKAEFDALADE